MPKISDILILDLKEDIKNVIDIEDHTELEIQQEIESYIITEGIGQHFYNFINQFTSHIKETGVWISGFYGSGKSYFGKMLGYILENLMVNGTPARERFIPRLKGINDKDLIEILIRNLDAINSKVVFLDIAKHLVKGGLAFTLFTYFLKMLGFRDDLYGYMEFELSLDNKLEDFKKLVMVNEGKPWDELKVTNREVAKIMRRTYMAMTYTEKEYEDTKELYENTIANFSANTLKSELEKYLKARSDETIVFIFDEASEAISQKKFNLLDLEAISEALSSIIDCKVWTIAIAQERLDDVINNANVNKSQLTKVTDRFKTKIHLESTDIDIIIRSRLLQKEKVMQKQLAEYYKKNEGLVSDATNLKSLFPTKTADAQEFAIYYPFHKYQFDILQKFLFSSKTLAATQVAARGMIITTFDVLRKQLRDKDLYTFAPGYAICTEAQTSPPVDLVSKYDTAKKILHQSKSTIDGEKLLKTIHLLTGSEIVSPTVENIAKSYIEDITKYYEVKPIIEKGLALLVDAKVLLLSNNSYKITSDREGRLLEEMNDFDVPLYVKKSQLTYYIKEYKLFNAVSMFSDGVVNYKFSILSDIDDELTGAGSKELKIIVYSLFNTSENRQDFIETIKLETQYQKDRLTLIPDNSEFMHIDKLIVEVKRYYYMEEKYSSESDTNIRQIIRDFAVIREEKEKDLRVKIENAYHNTSLVYLFDEHLLNADNFKTNITDIQRKMIKNIYTKKLASSLSEEIVPKLFSSRKEHLSRLFSGDDFTFFDSHGNFTGDHLKAVEEISAKIKNRHIDGKTLETELSGPPWGYQFGTIVSTLAALFRAGRLSVKYNGQSWFSYKQKEIQEAFTNTTKFKTASFKSISATLSLEQKNRAVQLLLDLELETHTDRKIDWNTNDFDIADSIRIMAEHFIEVLSALNDSFEDFESHFPLSLEQKNVLASFTGKITESNYIEKVEYLLANKDQFTDAIQTIMTVQQFMKKNYNMAKEYRRFVDDVVAELKKADKKDNQIENASNEFYTLYKQDMVKNFSLLQKQSQIVKDIYFKLIKNAADGMSHAYQVLFGKIDKAISTLKKYPKIINTENQNKLDELKQYCMARNIKEPVLEYSVKCKNTGYSLSDIMNYTALVQNKENELMIRENSFVIEETRQVNATRKVLLTIKIKNMTVGEYRNILGKQLGALAGCNDNDEIVLTIET